MAVADRAGTAHQNRNRARVWKNSDAARRWVMDDAGWPAKKYESCEGRISALSEWIRDVQDQITPPWTR